MGTCTHCLRYCAARSEDMNISAQRTSWSLIGRLVVAFTGLGSICVAASMLVAYLIADHSFSPTVLPVH